MHGANNKTWGKNMQHSKKHQRGISLYIVIIIVLLSMLLALWGSRTAIFNEMIVGNDADYQRAYEAAQAMLQDAELDIQQKTADGTSCKVIEDKVCRSNNGGMTAITTIAELQGFTDTMNSKTAKCFNGLCSKRLGAQDFWNNPTTMTAMTEGSADDNTNIAARYGQYTGAISKDSDPILNNTKAGEGAWYWIEIMKYQDEPAINMVGRSANAGLGIKAQLVYRITAIARGLKPSTQVVLQSAFVLQPPDE